MVIKQMTAVEISELLKAKGIRPTPQRISVYQYLYDNRIHASAEMIFAALAPKYPSFSKTTIYNSIRTLVEKGLIRTVSIEDDFVRYDANTQDHGHFKCLSCGKLYDFPASWPSEPPEELKGFLIETKDQFFYGVCNLCRINQQ